MTLTPLRFSAAALCSVLRSQGLGEPHIALRDSAVWYPPDERGANNMQAWAEFAEQGLTDRSDGLHALTLAWLPALTRAPVEYYCWVTIGAETTVFLVAPFAEEAVLVMRRADEVQLIVTDPDHLAETLIRQLPAAKTPRARSVSVRRSELSEAGGAGVVGGGDGERFLELAAQPALGLGELYVAVRDPLGGRRTMTEPVRYRDTEDGRWMVCVDGDYLSMVPATPALFAVRLAEARERLARP